MLRSLAMGWDQLVVAPRLLCPVRAGPAVPQLQGAAAEYWEMQIINTKTDLHGFGSVRLSIPWKTREAVPITAAFQ